MSIQRLAADAVIYCLAFLDDDSLLTMCVVNRYFASITNHTGLWKTLLDLCLSIDDASYPPGYISSSVPSEYNPKNQYLAWKRSFSGYSLARVGQVRTFWKRFTTWCAIHAPPILATLGSPATEEDIAQVEATLPLDIPVTQRLLYRFHNGQNLQSRTYHLGMFGGTMFYEMLTCMNLLPLEQLFVTDIRLNLMKESDSGEPRCHDISHTIAFGIFSANPGIISKLYVLAPNPEHPGDVLVCTNAGE